MAKNSAKRITTSVQFRRLIHSKKDLRAGLTTTRFLVEPKSVPKIVSELCRVPIYANHFALDSFPRDISRIKTGRPLQPVNAELDVIWNASVISLYSKKLNEFIELRTTYEHAYLNSYLDKAVETLELVEERFGTSVWLIDARLRTLQLRDGLTAQKAYLEKVLNTASIDAYVAALAYYFSFSAQENVSVADINAELEPISRGDHLRELKDHFCSRINPFLLTQIAEPWKCISFNENSPIIDRLQSFTTMITLQVIRDPGAMPYIKFALGLLRSLKEPRLNNVRILTLEDDETLSLSPQTYLGIFDAYTAGLYEDCCSKLQATIGSDPYSAELYPLAARAFARLKKSCLPPSLSEKIIELLRALYCLTNDVPSTKFTLQKMALLVRDMPAAPHLIAAIAHSQARPPGLGHTDEDKIAALSSSISNPWSQQVLQSYGLPVDSIYAKSQNGSISHQLQTLSQPSPNLEASLESLRKLSIPRERTLRYSGHACISNLRFDLAATYYRDALEISDDLQYLGNISSLVDAHLLNGELDECLRLVTNAYLKTTNTHYLFPLETILLSTRGSIGDMSSNLIDHSIVAYIYSRHVGTQFDGDLSDAYETLLDFLECSRPSEIDFEACDIQLERLIFFLRHICTIRILEDSTAFHSVEDIELERIRILQMLIERDPEHSATYAEEIGSITKDMEVSRLFQSFETSRIYADEEGIIRAVESNLKDSFARYIRLLNDPGLEYQAGEIARRMKELLDKSDRDQQVRDFHLPSTEREELFRSMHHSFVDAFVMNPDYGLKTYLSTNILHGALEGELRSSLSKHGLLFTLDNIEEEMRTYWEGKLGPFSENEWSQLLTALTRFSDRVTEQIMGLRNEVIRVRLIDSPTGFFDFTVTGEEMDSLMGEVTSLTTFEDYTKIMLRKFWQQVDRSLERVKDELRMNFSGSVMLALETLNSSLENILPRASVLPLIDAISHARIEFALDVDRVLGWFSRSEIKANYPFSIETAAAVALKVTNNCFPRTPISPKMELDIPGMFRGDLLDAFVHIIHNCLQNALQRSGIKDVAPSLSLYATVVDNCLLLEVRNELAKSTDLAALRERVHDFLLAAEAAKNPSAVSKEGGAGLRKIFRSLRADLEVQPNVSCDVTNNFEFQITIAIPLAEVAVAHIPH